MKYLKGYKIFESSNNTEDILFDLNDIFIDLEDHDFIEKKILVISPYVPFEYSIKNNELIIKDDRINLPEYWSNGADSSLELLDKVKDIIIGFNFLIKVDLSNFNDVLNIICSVVKYMKENKDWDIDILYSWDKRTLPTNDIRGSWFNKEKIKEMDDDFLYKLINNLKIKNHGDKEQVPDRIMFKLRKLKKYL
jgi:hypothetical protein